MEKEGEVLHLSVPVFPFSLIFIYRREKWATGIITHRTKHDLLKVNHVTPVSCENGVL